MDKNTNFTFLAFTPNPAASDFIRSKMGDAKIEIKERQLEPIGEKTQGCVFYVIDEKKDEASDILSTPDEMLISVMVKERQSEREESDRRDAFHLQRRNRVMRSFARMSVLIAVLYIIFVLITK